MLNRISRSLSVKGESAFNTNNNSSTEFRYSNTSSLVSLFLLKPGVTTNVSLFSLKNLHGNLNSTHALSLYV